MGKPVWIPSRNRCVQRLTGGDIGFIKDITASVSPNDRSCLVEWPYPHRPSWVHQAGLKPLTRKMVLAHLAAMKETVFKQLDLRPSIAMDTMFDTVITGCVVSWNPNTFRECYVVSEMKQYIATHKAIAAQRQKCSRCGGPVEIDPFYGYRCSTGCTYSDKKRKGA